MGSWMVVAVAAGVAIGVQVAVLGYTSRGTNPLGISLALQVGGVLVGAIWATSQQAWPGTLGVALQWWWLPLGAVGWAIVAALGYAAAKGGVSATLAIVVGSQILIGLVADRATGHLQISMRHVVGVLLLVAGVLLVSART